MHPHILIVDDEDGPREALEFVLRRANRWWRTSTAASVEEARQIIESPSAEVGPVDIVLTDLVMGDNEAAGMELLDFVRRHDPFLMAILFTAKSKTLDRFEAFEIGAFDCIEKNILGRAASQEIVVKTKAAVAFRNTARAHLESLRMKQEVEAALRKSEERYALASRAANDGLWDWDLEAGEVYYSPRWKGLLGYEEDELGTEPDTWFDLIHPDDVAEVKAQIREHLMGLTPRLDCEYRIRCKDESIRWMACRALVEKDDHGTPSRMVGSQADITSRKELEEQLRAQVFRDALTGLANRTLVVERIEHAIRRARDPDAPAFALLLVTFDRFQKINESFGSESGDQVLIEIGRRFVERVRTGDTVARLGGAEFAMLLEGCSDLELATRLAERLQESLSMVIPLGEHEVFLTSRAGLCLGGADDDAAGLLLAAQAAAAQAKEANRSLVVYQDQMRDDAPLLMKLEGDLRRALERGQLQLHFQPIMRLASKRVVGFETLLRWNHPSRGLVSPAQFIPLAEETGLIVEIGRWVLDAACRQMQAWHDAYPQSRGLSISVNVSGPQWMQPELPSQIEDSLASSGLPAGKLKLEITETVLMGGQSPVTESMERVRELGVEIYVDDFGTGYSSMSVLHDFPVSTIKIDRSFVRRMDGGGGDEIVRTILELGKKLDLTTVAEGIETPEQLATLRELGCDLGQGFLFAKPMTKPAIETRLFGRQEMGPESPEES